MWKGFLPMEKKEFKNIYRSKKYVGKNISPFATSDHRVVWNTDFKGYKCI